ncbi:MAG: helix-turn-helix domain-containing protein [Thermomicrobiales bacterium]
MSAPREGLLTVAEVATRLGRSTEQVRRYLRESHLRGQRLGGQWFVEVASLDAFQGTIRQRTGFLESIAPADPEHNDPLAAVIGIGHGGGSDIAAGKDAYRRAFERRA